MFPARSTASMLALVVQVLLASPAYADDHSYRVTGKDSFQIGAHDLRGEISYDGTQRLSVTRDGKSTRYVAKVSYTKTDQGATSRYTGSFASTILADGTERDDGDGDPDYLTILNQPFAVQLDIRTLREVAQLDQAAPFSFLSPMTGAQLKGTLRHAGDGLIAGERVIGVGFAAQGRMKGAIPEHPEIALDGTIRMSGTAYYTEKAALLLALDATLTITGNLADRATSDPVTIVYRRVIRAEETAALRDARR